MLQKDTAQRQNDGASEVLNTKLDRVALKRIESAVLHWTAVDFNEYMQNLRHPAYIPYMLTLVRQIISSDEFVVNGTVRCPMAQLSNASTMFLVVMCYSGGVGIDGMPVAQVAELFKLNDQSPALTAPYCASQSYDGNAVEPYGLMQGNVAGVAGVQGTQMPVAAACIVDESHALTSQNYQGHVTIAQEIALKHIQSQWRSTALSFQLAVECQPYWLVSFDTCVFNKRAFIKAMWLFSLTMKVLNFGGPIHSSLEYYLR